MTKKRFDRARTPQMVMNCAHECKSMCCASDWGCYKLSIVHQFPHWLISVGVSRLSPSPKRIELFCLYPWQNSPPASIALPSRISPYLAPIWSLPFPLFSSTINVELETVFLHLNLRCAALSKCRSLVPFLLLHLLFVLCGGGRCSNCQQTSAGLT